MALKIFFRFSASSLYSVSTCELTLSFLQHLVSKVEGSNESVAQEAEAGDGAQSACIMAATCVITVLQNLSGSVGLSQSAFCWKADLFQALGLVLHNDRLRLLAPLNVVLQLAQLFQFAHLALELPYRVVRKASATFCGPA